MWSYICDRENDEVYNQRFTCESHDGSQPILSPAERICPRMLLHDTIIGHSGIMVWVGG